jgi:hypothetical protein
MFLCALEELGCKAESNRNLAISVAVANPQSATATTSADAESDDFFAFSDHEQEAHSSRQRFRNEGISYLQCKEYKKDLSMLLRFPLVMQLFSQTNTTTASSAPVERLFSCAGQIFLPRRNRLSDESFEHLLFLKKNVKFY